MTPLSIRTGETTNMIELNEKGIVKIDGDVSSPKGFEAKGIHIGLRYSKKTLD